VKTSLIAPVLIGAAALLAAGCATHQSAAEDDGNSTPKAVRMAVVELSKNPDPARYSAIIAPNAQVDLAFRVSGYVVQLSQTKGGDGRIRPLEAGATVTAGATLARIRASEFQAIVDKARGVSKEAEAGIRAAEAQIAEAQAGLAQAELDFERVSKLWEQESITKPVYDGSKARLDIARSKVDAAKAASIGVRERMGSASAQVRESEIALGDTVLRAPFGGVLLERRVELGALVAAGTPAFILADMRLVKGRFNVPDSALHNFRQGQSLDLTVDAFPGETFHGRVLSLAAAADPRVRSFEIEVAIANPGLKLRSGMIAAVQAAEAEGGHLLPQIPVDALVRDPTGDRYLVYTTEQKAGRTFARAIPIRPGPLSGAQILILDGLTPGQRIVVSGANLLRSGEAVREVE
jgi:RND family efflux transporter MFP subunit